MALPEASWIRPPKGAGLHTARRAFQVATSLVFIAAPFVDLLRFDVKNGALVLGGVSLGLGELSLAYPILLVAFVAVFAGALLYGRIYCGWMCPQTTLSELVATLERWVGPRRGPRPLRARVLSTLTSVGFSAFVAASLVTYFVDPADRFSPGPITLGAFAATFVVLAGDLIFLRHGFCVGVCPYGILQNVIQDTRTLGVRLDPARRTECVDCLLCVRACFMGVDIRSQAFDPRCLNCGDCIAATRLAKRCPEEPLIAFRYGTAGSSWPAWLRRLGILDGRRAVVAALFLGGLVLVVLQTTGRADLDLQVAAQFELTEVADGLVRDHYQLTVGNRLHQPLRLRLEATGFPGLAVLSPDDELELAPAQRAQREIILTAPASAGAGAHEIAVRAFAPDGQLVAEIPTRFFIPDRR